MASLDCGIKSPGKPQMAIWKNFEVRWVDDAVTLWLREIPSPSCSPELKNFQLFEKQFNTHFNHNFRKHFEYFTEDEIGKSVVVQFKGQYFRGKLESIASNKRHQVIEVFLLDYAKKLKTENSSVELLEPGNWTSVPYLAKQVKLFAISPLALDYSLSPSQFKLIPRMSTDWDAAATSFVQGIFDLKHTVQFVPVESSSDGYVAGLLAVNLKLEDWNSFQQSFSRSLPKLLDIKLSAGTNAAYVKEDLAKMLVQLGFGNYDNNVLEGFCKAQRKKKNCRLSDECSDSGENSSSRSLSSAVAPVTLKRKGRKIELSRLKSNEAELVLDKGKEVCDARANENNSSRSSQNGKDVGIDKSQQHCQFSEEIFSSLASKNDALGYEGSVKDTFPENHMSDGRSSSVPSISGNTSIKIDSSCKLHASEIGINEKKAFQNGVEGESPKVISKVVIERDEASMARIPSVSNPRRVLRNGSICLVSQEQLNKDGSLIGQTGSKAVIECNNEKDSSYSECGSIFEGMTSSARSGFLEGVTLVPAKHSQALTEAVRCCLSRENNRLPSKDDQCIDRSDESSDGLPDTIIDVEASNVDKKTNQSPQGLVNGHSIYKPNNSNLNSLRGSSLISTTVVRDKIFQDSDHAPNNNVKKLGNSLPHWVCRQLLQNLKQSKVNDCSANDTFNNLTSHISDENSVSCMDAHEIDEGNCVLGNDESVLVVTPSDNKENMESLIQNEQDEKEGDIRYGGQNFSLLANVGEEHVHVDIFEEEDVREIISDDIPGQKETSQSLNASFMSDSRDVWTEEKVRDLKENEFSSLLSQKHVSHDLNIAKLFRVYVTGGVISNEKVIVNEDIVKASFNPHVTKMLKNAGMKATRLQAYAWPAISSGSSTIIVGDRFSGKTHGYILPLVSTVIDCWKFLNKRLNPGIGAIMVVVCSDWRRAKCAADSFISVVPDIHPRMKVVTAWGGCGHDDVTSTKIELLKGCDVLITTPPCLVRLITGKMNERRSGSNEETRDTPATSLNRCCYFIIDDADLTLDCFANDIKQLLKVWGEGQQDLHRQLVITSSEWTPLLNSLVKNLYDVIKPTIIISSPGEAAICSHVKTSVYHLQDKTEVISSVGQLILDRFRNQKNLVFVKSDREGQLLKKMLENSSLYCIYIQSNTNIWKLNHFVHEWHEVQALTLIVSEKSVYYVLHHDLANADAIFHSYLPRTVTKFTMRYAFLVEKFSSEFENHSKCESHVIVEENFALSNPEIMSCLNRLCKEIPKSLISLQPEAVERTQRNKALCYYLKAYGKCLERSHCKFRHEIMITDVPKELPRFGEVTFSVVKVINASRLLVRLNEFRERPDSTKINLQYHYLKLFYALQKHYGNELHQMSLEYAEVGMYCIVKDKENWVRAKIDSIDYSDTTTYIVVFLVDEGMELRVKLQSALILHPKFYKIPGLIVEAYLCCIKPLDSDIEWTFHASQHMNEILRTRSSNMEFVGRIALSLDLTLWLSPVVEVGHIGRSAFLKRSLRAELITQGYGEDNKDHLPSLKEKCMNANITLSGNDFTNSDWLMVVEEAQRILETIGAQDVKSLNDEEEEERETSSSSTVYESLSSISSSDLTVNGNQAELYDAVVEKLHGNAENDITCQPSFEIKVKNIEEELPISVELGVKIGNIESCDQFFIQREDKIDCLEELEEEIFELTKCWEESSSTNADKGLPWTQDPNLLPTSHCLAKFTDGRFYRGRVETDEADEKKKVFFIDYGETLLLDQVWVQPCPRDLVDRMPAQAIPCCLAHVTIPAALHEKAVDIMGLIADSADDWILNALKVKDFEDGKRYVVELKCGSNPSKELWRELVSRGTAVHEDEEEAGNASTSMIDEDYLENEEVVQFMQSIPGMQAHLENVKANHIDRNKKEMYEIDNGNKAYQKIPNSKQVEKKPSLQQNDSEVKSFRKTMVASQEFHERCLQVPPLQAVEGVTPKLSPETSWSQTEDKITLKIYLMGVQLYRSRIANFRITFMTLLQDKFYAINEALEEEIDVDQSYTAIKGMYVTITLMKAVKKNWSLPFAEKCRRRWLRAEIEGSESDESTDMPEFKLADWKLSSEPSELHTPTGLPAGISDEDDSSCGFMSDDEYNVIT